MGAKGGRPSKLTETKKRRYLEALRTGATIKSACEVSGLIYDTVQDWMQRGKGEHPTRKPLPEYVQFVQDSTRAIADAEMILLSRINTASSHDWRAAGWILERRHPGRWANTQRINVEVEKRVAERIGGEVALQHNLLFEKIMNDDSLSADAKKAVLQHAATLENASAKAAIN